MALKLYTAPAIPNPDVVKMYLEETGRQYMVENINLNVGKMENRSDKNPNPLGEVPCLVLADGTALSESVTIVEFLDDVSAGGSTPILGMTAQERAVTSMWLKRVEFKVLEPIGSAFRNGPLAGFFKDRRPGTIHPENAAGERQTGVAGMKWLDSDLSDGRHFLCGDRFSLADIRLYCVLAFYLKIDKNQSIPADCKNLQALMERIGSRASAKALIPSKM